MLIVNELGYHHRLLRQKAAHKIQKTEYTDSMNIKVAHILDQMLEDKSTQTTVRTYIKVTTHSPTHRHIHAVCFYVVVYMRLTALL